MTKEQYCGSGIRSPETHSPRLQRQAWPLLPCVSETTIQHPYTKGSRSPTALPSCSFLPSQAPPVLLPGSLPVHITVLSYSPFTSPQNTSIPSQPGICLPCIGMCLFDTNVQSSAEALHGLHHSQRELPAGAEQDKIC